jgi:hypothetical protein
MGYAYELVVRQTAGRVADPWIHAEPLHYYVTAGLPAFLPWVLLAVPAAWLALRRRGAAAPMLLGWCALGFVFFSALSGKRVPYVLPLAPPLALLVAWWVHERRDLAARLAGLLLAAAGGALFALGCGAGDLLLRRLDGPTARALGPIEEIVGRAPLLAIGAAAAAAGLLAAARTLRAAPLSLALGVAAAFLVADACVTPRLDAVRSPRASSALLDELVPPGAGEVAIHPDAYFGAFNLYSRRLRLVTLATAGEVLAFLDVPGRAVLMSRLALVSEDEEGRRLDRTLPHGIRTLSAGRVGRSNMVIVINPGR